MGRDIILVNASAGGVEALSILTRGLPANLPADLFVVLHVLHVSRHDTSVLPSILSRAGDLPAHHAEDGETIVHGHIYAAPPDRHLRIDGDRVRVVRGPRENGHRPAIVQAPAEALFKGKPTSAIENVRVDHILPIAEIASKLIRLCQEKPKPLENIHRNEIVSGVLERVAREAPAGVRCRSRASPCRSPIRRAGGRGVGPRSCHSPRPALSPALRAKNP